MRSEFRMNISLLHLTISSAIGIPHLTVPGRSIPTSVSIQNGRFTRFCSHFFLGSAIRLSAGSSIFKQFQNSAVVLSSDPSSTGQTFQEPVVDESGDGFTQASFTTCVFEECQSPDDGGAIRTKGFLIRINNCQFNKCTAGKNGGAIHALSNDNNGWIGQWTNANTLPGVEIRNSVFSQCYVTGDPDQQGDANEIGYALYTRAAQTGIFGFTVEDCSRKGGNRAAVFYLWCNDLMADTGNMTIHPEFAGDDVSVCHVQYAGAAGNGNAYGDLNIPAVAHKFHVIQGFKAEHVYWADTKDDQSSHVLDYIDVINTTLVNGAIFYAHNDGSGSGHQLIVNYCNVYGVEGTGKFYDVYFANGNNPITPNISFCTTDVSEWDEHEKEINVTYVNMTIVEPDIESASEELVIPDDESKAQPLPDTDENPGKSGGNNKEPLSNEVIAAIAVVCSLIVIALVCLLVVLMLRRKKSSSSKEEEEHELDSDTAYTMTTTAAWEAETHPMVQREKEINQIFEITDTTDFQRDFNESM